MQIILTLISQKNFEATQNLSKLKNKIYFQSFYFKYYQNFKLIILFAFQFSIAPTEYDNVYRHQLCHGIVHDETAWFLGGVSGNAGIFSTANDLAKFMNMMLNRGEYINSRGKKVQIFQPETVDLFTTRETNVPYPNSRALGWDTVPIQSVLPCGTKFSQNSFGHTGFTGTTAWADKEKDLAIVILANRVYPDRNHSGTASLYFRQDLYTQVCTILGY